MMDVGPPDQKRPRLAGPPPGSWQTSQDTSRQLPSLPPPPPLPYNHGLPYTRPPESQTHIADRRPSEPAPWDHQDHRRPSSGPSHGYPAHAPPPPPYGGPRDTMVKRDPAEDTPQHQYRPNPTGNGPDHNVNPPHHEGPARPIFPPYDPAQARPAPYPPYPPPPPGPPHPHSPMSANEPYSHPGYGPSSGLPPPRDYSSVTYPSSSARAANEQVRKKAQRAAQACDSCRTLKAKCDEGRPACSSCKEKNIECRYRDPPPKQQDKASADIMEGIMLMKGEMNSMNTKFDFLTQEVLELRRNQTRLATNPNAGVNLKEEIQEGVPLGVPVYARPSVGAESQVLTSNESPYASTPGQRSVLERIEHLPEQPLEPPLSPPRPGPEGEEEEESGGDPGPAKDSSIPINHTTGAARLLLLKPIADMCKDIISHPRIRNEKYPIVQETKRGMLRLFGRGEGPDHPPGYDKDPLTDHGAEGTPGDTQSDASTPPAGEEWGQLGGLTPPGNPPPEITRGGISPEGMPDLSRQTVELLVESYKDNINIMHPILIPRQLNTMIETFLKYIPDSQAKPRQVSTLVATHAPPAGFVGGGYRNPESPGTKRKRSPGSGDYPEQPQSMLDYKPGHPFRTINTALVLLVMALGKICQWKGKLPDVVPDKEGQSKTDKEAGSSWNSSPTMRNGHPQSPIQSSPSMTTPMGAASPQDMDRTQSRSRRTSIEGPYYMGRSLQSKPRNLDVIPGLAYFALATDILGNQLGGNSLQHVHAHILAGLYHGQLARVMESSAYIGNACRILQVILRPKLDRFKKIKDKRDIVPAKDNPLIFAFWTCLQLESDIVAELPCPHSGILTFEDDMPGPNLQAACDVDGFHPRIIESYSAQLFLRKHLNQLHNMFYKPDNDTPFPAVFTSKETTHFPTIEASQASLNIIDKVAPTMVWNVEKGEPARDVLGARLRAKYYGAQVITYRHFVVKILEMSSAPSTATEQFSNELIQDVDAPRVDRNATKLEDIDPKIREYALNGLKALIHSTRAFHGLGDPGRDRLNVTNVWGTAHAQWGNLLVLQAAWKDPILRKLLDELINTDELIELLEKTLAFLKLVMTSTSALFLDYKILQVTGTTNQLLGGPYGPNTSSSFSSITTADVPIGGH